MVEGVFTELDPFTKDGDVIEVSATGAGCLLIKTDVFKRINTELREEPFTISPPQEEDLSFFKRVNKLGIKTYLAKNIRCGHYANVMITKDHYDIFNKKA